MTTDYGTTIGSVSSGAGLDMDPYWRRVSGGKAVAVAVARRLLVGKGSLWWAPDVGFGESGILGLIDDDITADRIPMIERLLRAECEADERVLGADVTLTFDATASSLACDVLLELGSGPFRFVLQASAVSVSLLLSP